MSQLQECKACSIKHNIELRSRENSVLYNDHDGMKDENGDFCGHGRRWVVFMAAPA
jgi:hypothetical protein